MTYHPATADQLLALAGLRRDRRAGAVRTLRRRRARHGRRRSSRASARSPRANGRRSTAIGDTEGAKLENGVVRLPDGLRRGLRALCRAGLERDRRARAEFGGQGLPFSLAMLRAGEPRRGQLALHPAADADRRRDRGARASRQRGAEGALPAQAGQRRMVGHDEPDRAAGRQRRRRAAHHRHADRQTASTRASTASPAPRSTSPGASTSWPTTSSTSCWRALPGAPEGSRGISLFVVPKYLVNADGTLGQRNDLRCVSLEHKLGIHASPTCVMSYGDNDECIGELVGRAEPRACARCSR